MGLFSIVVTCSNGIGTRLTERLVLTTAKSAPLSSLICLLGVVITAATVVRLTKPIERFGLKRFIAVGFVLTLMFQIWWIVAQGSNDTLFSDSRQLLSYASALSSGQLEGYFDTDISGRAIADLLPGTKYLVNYPYQSGILLYFSIIYKIFGSNAPLLIQLLNAIANSISYVLLVFISSKTFSSKATAAYTSLMGLLCIPLYLYASFFYGNQVGLCAALVVLASNVWAMSAPTRTSLGLNAVVSTVFLILMTWLKSTYVLLAYAVAIIWLIKLLNNPSRKLVCGACLFLIALAISDLASSVPQTYLEHHLGYELGDGMPKTSWIAIGLENESVLGETMPGWWGPSALRRQLDCHNDINEQSISAQNSIKESLKKLIGDPVYGFKFFMRKIATEWLTPDYQSRYFAGINTRVSLGTDGESETQFNVDAEDPYETQTREGVHRDVVWNQIEGLNPLMDAMQSFIYLFAAAGSIDMFRNRKGLSLESLLCPCCFFIGFLVFLLWEAKAQYILTFYVLLYPLAAYGLARTVDLFKQRKESKFVKVRS